MTIVRPSAAIERGAHTALCLQYLATQSPATIAEVAEATGLSRPTVGTILGELAAGPLVEELQPQGSKNGRPAREYSFSGGGGYVAGVDFGPNVTRVVVADLTGGIVDRLEISESPGTDLASQIDRVVTSITRSVSTLKHGLPGLRSVCLGVSGIVGPGGNVSVSYTLAEWAGMPVSDALQARLGCPVFLENDVKLAALAEQRIGAGRGKRDIAYFEIGNRMSLAIILDGKIRQGSRRTAGELSLLSANSDWAQAEKAISEFARNGGDYFLRAGEGDAAAQEAISSACDRIAEGLASVTLMIDPELVIIGGGLSRAGDAFLKPLREAIHRHLRVPGFPDIVNSSLWSDATALGALGTAFDRSSAEIFSIDDYSTPWAQIAHGPQKIRTQ